MTREEVISVLNRMQEQNRAKELPLTKEEWVAIFSATRHLNNDLSEPQGLDEAAEEYSKHAPHKQIAKMDFIAGAEWKTQQLQWYHIEDLTIERTDEGDCVASEPLLLGWQGPNRDTCRVVIPKPKCMIGRYEWAIPLSELTKLPKHDTSQT